MQSSVLVANFCTLISYMGSPYHIDCVNMKWKTTFQAGVIMSVTALDPPPLLVHMHRITNETSRSVRDGIYNAGYLSVC